MTMCGSDMSKVGREEFVPAKEFQLRWCQSYLSGLHNVPLQKVYKREYISYIANLINYTFQYVTFLHIVINNKVIYLF